MMNNSRKQGRRSHLKGGAEKNWKKDSAHHGWAPKKTLYFASFQVIPRSHLIIKIKHLSKIHNCHQFNFKTFQIRIYVNMCRLNPILIEIIKYHSSLENFDFAGLWFD